MEQPLQATHESVAGSHSSVAAQVELPAAQLSAPSSQLSAPLQATPSSQLRAVPLMHARALQVSSTVQNEPSSQIAPSFGLQPARLCDGRQISQPLSGFSVPAA
jgi:hypothetical protein